MKLTKDQLTDVERMHASDIPEAVIDRVLDEIDVQDRFDGRDFNDQEGWR